MFGGIIIRTTGNIDLFINSNEHLDFNLRHVKIVELKLGQDDEEYLYIYYDRQLLWDFFALKQLLVQMVNYFDYKISSSMSTEASMFPESDLLNIYQSLSSVYCFTLTS